MFINPLSSSIYGAGVLNDTIVPGYPATMAPVNLFAFSQLRNGTTRNYGEATQYVTYPQGYPDYMYDLGYQYTGPNHFRLWDPLCFGTGLNLNNGYTTDPAAIEAGNALAAQAAINFTDQMIQNQVNSEINASISSIAQTLAQMDSAIEQYMNSDKVSEAQKASLQKLREKVKAKKEEIEAKMKEKQLSKKDVEEIQKDLKDNLAKEVTDTLTEIKEKVAKGDKSAPSGKSSSSDDSSDEKANKETGRAESLGEAPKESECEDICSKINTAVNDFWGTDNKALAEGIESLNASNIIEVVRHWENGYGKHTATGNKGFFARIFDDINDSDQKKYVPIMLKALTERAEALGIYDEIKTYISNVNKELATFWHNDHTLANNLMEIVKKIEAKEKTNKAEAGKKSKTEKADEKKKADAKRPEVIGEKKSEFANELKAALNLDKVPELTSALKVETDENGEFTGYSIKVRTKNGEFTLKGTTYKELIAELEKHGLDANALIKKDLKA